jgi:hypothetical protein
VLPAPAAAGPAGDELDRHRPVLRYDSREQDFARTVPGRRERAVVYGRAAPLHGGRLWLQYWLYFAENTQDRGIFHTGRHEGDWELVQVGLDSRSRPAAVTYGQHSWAKG